MKFRANAGSGNGLNVSAQFLSPRLAHPGSRDVISNARPTSFGCGIEMKRDSPATGITVSLVSSRLPCFGSLLTQSRLSLLSALPLANLFDWHTSIFMKFMWNEAFKEIFPTYFSLFNVHFGRPITPLGVQGWKCVLCISETRGARKKLFV